MRTCHQIISSRVIKEEHKKCGWATFAISYEKLYYNTTLILVFPPEDSVEGRWWATGWGWAVSSPPPNTQGQQSWTSTDGGEAEPGKKLLSFFLLLKQRGSRLWISVYAPWHNSVRCKSIVSLSPPNTTSSDES